MLVTAAAIGLCQTRPPVARGLETPPDQFSAARAIGYLQHLTTAPHPRGSEANAKVRDYLLETLLGLGLQTSVEQTTARRTARGKLREGVVQNIIATLPGTDDHRAVMLVAHYDSVPAGPGAADDGAGVSSILETVRALSAGPPLANDLVVLLTDGEEASLLGAAGYVAAHPDLGRRVGLLINLEARGSSGPALMFETAKKTAGSSASLPGPRPIRSLPRSCMRPTGSCLTTPT